MKKLLLSMGALMMLSATSMASDEYRLVKSTDEVTPDGYYILAAPRGTDDSLAIMGCDANGQTYMPAINYEAEVDSEAIYVEEGNPEKYAIFQILTSQHDGHEGHKYLFVTNDGFKGYLTDQPQTSKTLKIHSQISSVSQLNTYHVTIEIAAESGDATICFRDYANSTKNCSYISYNSGSPRFAGYANTGQTMPRLYKLVDGSKEEILCSTDIEESLEVDINSDPLTLFSISNEEDTELMLASIEITTDEKTNVGDYTISYTDDSKIQVVFNKAGLYSFTASVDPEDENYRMIPVTVPTIKAVDPNAKPITPIFTPEGGKIYADKPISITGEGTIYYTLENIELSADNGTEYTEPFTISSIGEVTVKAISVTSNGKVSDVATATYIVKDVPQQFTIVFKKSSSQSSDGSSIDASTSIEDIVEEGVEYIESIEATDTYYASSYGLKFGTKDKEGSVTINLKKEIELKDIIANAASYNVKDGAELKVTAKVGDSMVVIGSQLLNDDSAKELEDYTYSGIDFETPIKSITFATTQKRGLLSAFTVKYEPIQVAAPEVPALTGLEGLDMVEPDEDDMGMIMSTDKVTINFGEVPEGIEIHYSVMGKENMPNIPGPDLVARKACDKADEHEGYTKHKGEDIVLDATHGFFSFFACDPENNLHSPVHTYMLDVATGVNEISAAENSEVLYFNLQGVRVANPENGAYIRVTNGKANKVMK